MKTLKTVIYWVIVVATFPATLLSMGGMGRRGTIVAGVALCSYIYMTTQAKVGMFDSLLGNSFVAQVPWYGWYILFLTSVLLFNQVKSNFGTSNAKINVEEKPASETTVEV